MRRSPTRPGSPSQLKLQIAKLTKARFGASSEHGAKLDQMALELEDLQESAAELDETATIVEAAGLPRR